MLALTLAILQNWSSPGAIVISGPKTPLMVRRVLPAGSGSGRGAPFLIFMSLSSITRSVMPESSGNVSSTSPTISAPDSPLEMPSFTKPCTCV